LTLRGLEGLAPVITILPQVLFSPPVIFFPSFRVPAERLEQSNEFQIILIGQVVTAKSGKR
jgi:hypothetical protein